MSQYKWSLLTDFYELTMMQGYFENGKSQKAIFDVFYRRNPNNAAYAVCAGLEQVIEYVKNLKFSDEDIEYLRKTGVFKEPFLEYLRGFKFTGEIYAMPEGSVIFPMEPIIKVKAPLIEAQIMEAAILNIMNHQCLIASKAERVVYAAGGGVMEFGLRRAQGPDAGTYGARAAIIAGAAGTSNVVAGQIFNIPVMGTHAHSWIMSFPTEKEAFTAYAKLYPGNCILLVDTYDTLKSGVKHAIEVFNEMKAEGWVPKVYGIRLDSGDLAYLTKKAREMLDAAGHTDAIICASGDLDEYLIKSLKIQGACIDSWGVGTKLITSEGWSSFGGVYKLSAVQKEDGTYAPKIKVSENVEKVTNPGDKVIFRIYDKETGKIRAELIALRGEKYDPNEDLIVFDPISTWKRTRIKGGTYIVRQMLETIFQGGECKYESPDVMAIQAYCKKELDTLWPESRRFENPQNVYVDLSQPLWDLKNEMLHKVHTFE
ncbi:MAG: nicotinate phosphoribosyltransferase [Lachnospiraceae bacterium]|nr:nicotinate phosphoribosyltransferase [Lachnospiraceae bacterium]